MLGLFSLPAGGRPLNLRRERHALVRCSAEIAAAGRAVDVRVLQYGVTRDRLREVLEEDEGWDVIHISGHGAPGELLLETDDGSPDPVTAAELAGLLDAGAGAGQAGDGVGVLVGGDDAGRAAAAARTCRYPRRQPAAGERAARRGGRRPGALATELAGGWGARCWRCGIPVVDDFAIALAGGLYDLLAGKGQPLPRAVGIALADPQVVADPPTLPARRCRR